MFCLFTVSAVPVTSFTHCFNSTCNVMFCLLTVSAVPVASCFVCSLFQQYMWRHISSSHCFISICNIILRLLIVVYGHGQIICGGAVRGCYRKSRDRKVTGTMSGSMFYACATGSCAISVLVGHFHRKWRQSRDRPEEASPDRKYVLRMPGFFHAPFY